MDTKTPTQKPAAAAPLEFGKLPPGTYTIALCVGETEKSTFPSSADGKTNIKFTTTYMIGSDPATQVQFAKSEDEQDVTNFGEPIRRIKFGQRVLFQHEHRTYDKATKSTQVIALKGRVIDVQTAA